MCLDTFTVFWLTSNLCIIYWLEECLGNIRLIPDGHELERVLHQITWLKRKKLCIRIDGHCTLLHQTECTCVTGAWSAVLCAVAVHRSR